MLRLTNLDKILYPASGTTKGDVIDYMTRIAPLLLPHLTGRPLTRKRWPDGVGTEDDPGSSFFTKDLERGAPDWIDRMPIDHSTGTKLYPLASDVPTLIYLAQMASLELHVPQWRFDAAGAPQNPDRLVLDLDPGPGVGLAECAEVARLAREILADMGLDPVPVTSGSKGIHLYAALPGTQTSTEVTAVAKALAQDLEADHPGLVVSAMKRSLRESKVFIDWSQNNAAKTTVSPYSLRGRAQPWVAAPRTWDELDDPDLAQLLYTEVLERAETIGDPMAALARPRGTGPLASYIAKRTAAKTPEPVPSGPHPDADVAPDAPRFVIHEHHASRRHFDLRLEHGGVLESWAVPKGIPETTARNHLAIMTEPHPLEYLTFAGTIPKGEYGAGTMTVWDTGTYTAEKWRPGEIIATLEGRPGGPLGRVRLALIRTEGEGEKSQWLAHRMSDAAEPTPRPMLATLATPGLARAAAARWAEADGGAWAEIKWDGVRALGAWDGRRLRILARSGNDVTAKYPELVAAAPAAFGERSAVVDGEIVALDARSRPSFPLLQARLTLTRPADITREAERTPTTWFLFDLLRDGDTDLTTQPLAERRAALEERFGTHTGRIAVPPLFDDVDDALAESARLGLEGVVVKNPHSRYRGGERSDDWLKLKFTRTQEVVIGGFRPGAGGRSATFGSLLVGIPEKDGTLRYAGRVGSGFSEKVLRSIRELLDARIRGAPPFADVPADVAREATWVRPDLVGEVAFAEFTPAGILRQARWRGLRPDRAADEVRREI